MEGLKLWKKIIQASVEQAKDVQEVVVMIKAMETKEAIKDLLALHVLKDLMELKAAQEAQ